MNNSGKIVQLLNPTNNQDAATKSYVDSIISYNGSGSLFPTVERVDTDNNTHYLTFIPSGDVPSSNGSNKRALLKCDINGPTYNPSTNTLTASTFSGTFSGNATSATTATSASYSTGKQFAIGTTSAGDSSLYIRNPDDTFQEGRARMRMISGSSATSLTIGINNGGEAFVWNESNTDLAFGTNNSRSMTIKADGKIGIGTYDPDCPLHVGTGTVVNLGGSYMTDGNVHRYSPGYGWTFSIRCQNALRVGADIVWNSDKRIKKNVKDIHTGIALTQIRQIRPKIYNYIDNNTKGDGNVYGFIAQDVKDVILHSTVCTKDYIPNFYCKGNISIVDVINNTYKIISENELVFEKVIDQSGNDVINYNVKIYGYDNSDYICSVLEIVNPKTIVVKLEKEYNFEEVEENNVFIYGQQVYDFHNLEKNTIYTVATAALQEVDRQQQADKARIAELEATVSAQQSLINDILERLKALEKV